MGSADPGTTKAAADPGGAKAAAAPAEAWAAAVAATPDLGGAAIALRGARVEGWDGEALTLRVPAGLRDDLSALLSDLRRSAPLRRNLAAALGVEEERLAVAIQDDAARRLTSHEASRQRMERWMSRDPRLEEAVRELDLTIKE